MTSKVPFKALLDLIEYLHHDELRGYCDCLMNGDCVGSSSPRPHVYLNVLRVRRWLKTFPEYQNIAEEYLGEAREQIRDAKDSAKDALKQKIPATAKTESTGAIQP